jgi:hypothetical protein
MSSLPYPENLARSYPPGTKPDRRRITKCSDTKAWYAGMVGQIITVHYFCTFGCWDIEGRWVDYYDLSQPVIRELSEKERKKLLNDELQRINEAIAHMNKWDDIPITMQLDSLCKILKITPDNGALNFCTSLFLIDKQVNAQKLFDLRKHEFKK